MRVQETPMIASHSSTSSKETSMRKKLFDSMCPPVKKLKNGDNRGIDPIILDDDTKDTKDTKKRKDLKFSSQSNAYFYEMLPKYK